MLDRLCLQLLFELRIPVPLGLGSVSKVGWYKFETINLGESFEAEILTQQGIRTFKV